MDSGSLSVAARSSGAPAAPGGSNSCSTSNSSTSGSDVAGAVSTSSGHSTTSAPSARSPVVPVVTPRFRTVASPAVSPLSTPLGSAGQQPPGGAAAGFSCHHLEKLMPKPQAEGMQEIGEPAQGEQHQKGISAAQAGPANADERRAETEKGANAGSKADSDIGPDSARSGGAGSAEGSLLLGVLEHSGLLVTPTNREPHQDTAAEELSLETWEVVFVRRARPQLEDAPDEGRNSLQAERAVADASDGTFQAADEIDQLVPEAALDSAIQEIKPLKLPFQFETTVAGYGWQFLWKYTLGLFITQAGVTKYLVPGNVPVICSNFWDSHGVFPCAGTCGRYQLVRSMIDFWEAEEDLDMSVEAIELLSGVSELHRRKEERKEHKNKQHQQERREHNIQQPPPLAGGAAACTTTSGTALGTSVSPGA